MSIDVDELSAQLRRLFEEVDQLSLSDMDTDEKVTHPAPPLGLKDKVAAAHREANAFRRFIKATLKSWLCKLLSSIYRKNQSEDTWGAVRAQYPVVVTLESIIANGYNPSDTLYSIYQRAQSNPSHADLAYKLGIGLEALKKTLYSRNPHFYRSVMRSEDPQRLEREVRPLTLAAVNHADSYYVQCEEKKGVPQYGLELVALRPETGRLSHRQLYEQLKLKRLDGHLPVLGKLYCTRKRNRSALTEDDRLAVVDDFTMRQVEAIVDRWLHAGEYFNEIATFHYLTMETKTAVWSNVVEFQGTLEQLGSDPVSHLPHYLDTADPVETIRKQAEHFLEESRAMILDKSLSRDDIASVLQRNTKKVGESLSANTKAIDKKRDTHLRQFMEFYRLSRYLELHRQFHTALGLVVDHFSSDVTKAILDSGAPPMLEDTIQNWVSMLDESTRHLENLEKKYDAVHGSMSSQYHKMMKHCINVDLLHYYGSVYEKMARATEMSDPAEWRRHVVGVIPLEVDTNMETALVSMYNQALESKRREGAKEGVMHAVNELSPRVSDMSRMWRECLSRTSEASPPAEILAVDIRYGGHPVSVPLFAELWNHHFRSTVTFAANPARQLPAVLQSRAVKLRALWNREVSTVTVVEALNAVTDAIGVAVYMRKIQTL